MFTGLFLSVHRRAVLKSLTLIAAVFSVFGGVFFFFFCSGVETRLKSQVRCVFGSFLYSVEPRSLCVLCVCVDVTDTNVLTD